MSKQYQLAGWNIVVDTKSAFSPLPYIAQQVHGGDIVRVAETEGKLIPADGVLINQNNLEYGGIRTADCLPLVLMTLEQALLLHVSRKTLLANLLEQVPQYLSIKDITAVFWGPHICADHFIFEYEGPELTAFKERFPAAIEQNADGLRLSLMAATMPYLHKWGIDTERSTFDGRCTYEEPDLPSYRRLFHAGQLDQLYNLVTAVRAA